MIKNLKQNGFSLMELMVAVGLVAGLSLVSMEIYQRTQSVSTGIMRDQAVVQTTLTISRLLQNEGSCTESFRNINPSGNYPAVSGNVNQIRRLNSDGSISVAYSTGDILGLSQTKLRIVSMTLSNLDSQTNLYKGSKETAFLTLVFQRGAGINTDLTTATTAEINNLKKMSNINRLSVIRRIPIKVVMDGATVSKCQAGSSLADLEQNICEELLNGTFAGGKCTEMHIEANQAIVNGANIDPTQLDAHGDVVVETAGVTFRTDNLKKPNGQLDFSDYNASGTSNKNFSLYSSSQIWAPRLSLYDPGSESINATATGDVATSGNIYVGATPTGKIGSATGLDIAGDLRLLDISAANQTDVVLTNFSSTWQIVPDLTAPSVAGDEDYWLVTAGWVANSISDAIPDGTALGYLDINNEILTNADVAAASDIMLHTICNSIRMRSLNPATKTAITVTGTYSPGAKTCTFNIDKLRNCSINGVCNRIEPTARLCIDGVCKTRWPYIKKSTSCRWRNACLANEKVAAERIGKTPNLNCCTYIFEDDI